MADLYSILAAGHGRSHIDGMNPEFRTALSAMLAGAPPEIAAEIGIQSGFRSPERQAELYQAALKKYGSEAAARKWVAPPGKSRHNHGVAADLSYKSERAKKWTHDNAQNFGLRFRMGHEDWHIEPSNGKASAGTNFNVADGPKGQEAYPAMPAEGSQMAMTDPNAVAPSTGQPAQTSLGSMLAGLGAAMPALPQQVELPRQDNGAQVMPAMAQQLAEKGRSLKNGFMPDLDTILGLSRRPV